jgi:hypothetical protein
MRHSKAVLIASIVALVLSANGGAVEERATAAKAEAKKAAEAWLEKVDNGRYAESWDDAASLFRRKITKSAWANAVQEARAPLGQLVSRKVKTAEFMTSLPGAPDGQYVVLQFETSFAHKASAVETVTPLLENGHWRVSGYYVK